MTTVGSPPGVRSPSEWGTEERIHELFGGDALLIEARRPSFVFRYRSAEHWLEIFRRFYGPVNRAFEALDEEKRQALAAEIIELLERSNRGSDSLLVPSEYLEVVIHVA